MKFDEESETNRLEAEIAEDETPVPRSRLLRFRRRGAMILYSKHVLMAVVLLNVVDCLLVTGELILDVHYIKEILEESDLESQRFVDQMQARYPDHLSGHDIDHMGVFHNALYRAKCYWDEDPTAICGNTNQIRKLLEAADTQHGDDDVTHHTDAHAHGPLEHVAHGLHKASIVILGVLFLENVTKIFCVGKRFLHRKIEVFDAIIVCASFILDLIFLRGIIAYRVQDGVLILSFLLPWRVIRVVNSLIVAVIDHEHLRLKMMYKAKKKLANELELEQHKTRLLKDQLRNIEDFLEKEGMPRWKFIHYTHFDEQRCSVASMASFALKGLFDGFFNVPFKHQGDGTPEVGSHSLTTDIRDQSENSLTSDINTGSNNVLFTLGEIVQQENGVTEKNSYCDEQREFTPSSLMTNPTKDNTMECSERTFCDTNDVTHRIENSDICARRHADTSVDPPGNTNTEDIPINRSDTINGELNSPGCDVDIRASFDSTSKIGETLQDQIDQTCTPIYSLKYWNQTSKQWDADVRTQNDTERPSSYTGNTVRLPSDVGAIEKLSSNSNDVERLSSDVGAIEKLSSNGNDVERLPSDVGAIEKLSRNGNDVERLSSDSGDIERLSSDVGDTVRLSSDGPDTVRLSSDGSDIVRLSSDGPDFGRLFSDGRDFGRLSSDDGNIARLSSNGDDTERISSDGGDFERLFSNGVLTSTNESKTQDLDGFREPDGSTIETHSDKADKGRGVDQRDSRVDTQILIHHF